MKRFSWYLYMLLSCLTCFSCQKEDDISITFLDSAEAEKKVAANGTIAVYLDSAALNKAIKASDYSSNKNKSVGVLGGSLSCNSESVFAKYLWAHYLGWNIFTYGIGGYGFSSLQGSIQDQADALKPHDIYILWASTNDYTNNREIGSPTDYTAKDDYDKTKLVTQCGGMNYCIKKCREKNPECKIYVFGSLPFYLYEGGYKEESNDKNTLGYSFQQYIDAQKQVAEYQGLKFFNQFDIPVLTKENSTRFYKTDLFHLNEQGYANVGVYQLYFLSTETEMVTE